MPWRAAAWARKEALLKARGTGLRVEPASVEAFAEPPDGTVLIDLDTVGPGPARRLCRSAGRRGNGVAAKLGGKPMPAGDV